MVWGRSLGSSVSHRGVGMVWGSSVSHRGFGVLWVSSWCSSVFPKLVFPAVPFPSQGWVVADLLCRVPVFPLLLNFFNELLERPFRIPCWEVSAFCSAPEWLGTWPGKYLSLFYAITLITGSTDRMLLKKKRYFSKCRHSQLLNHLIVGLRFSAHFLSCPGFPFVQAVVLEV